MQKKRSSIRRKKKQWKADLLRFFLTIAGLLAGYGGLDYYQNHNLNQTLSLLGISNSFTGESYALDGIPAYAGEPYVVIENNIPDFDDRERYMSGFEYYSDLDTLGRCGMAEAMLTYENLPREPREEIGMIRPSGWHTVKYDCISDRYLYNRCHLLAFELTGENANEKNLITGTRYMNVTGMLPFENMVAQYIRDTQDKVLYRVTPVFYGNDLVARGVHMEAESIGTKKIQFNIFVYNVQPGIVIDYRDGESWQE